MTNPFSRRELIRRSGWLALLLPMVPEAGRAAAQRLADLGGEFPWDGCCSAFDPDIDFSDIPDSTPEELAAFRRPAEEDRTLAAKHAARLRAEITACGCPRPDPHWEQLWCSTCVDRDQVAGELERLDRLDVWRESLSGWNVRR